MIKKIINTILSYAQFNEIRRNAYHDAFKWYESSDQHQSIMPYQSIMQQYLHTQYNVQLIIESGRSALDDELIFEDEAHLNYFLLRIA